MANIKDVARLAGVSISTVSRVVNHSATVADDKQEAVLHAMKELNYQPNSFAKALVSRKSDTIGVVVENFSSPASGLLLQGIETVAHQADKQMIVATGHGDPKRERKAIQSLINRRCDALVIHSTALTDFQLMELLKEHSAATLIDRAIPDIPEQCVSLDHRTMAREAVNCLLDQGHQSVALLTSNQDSYRKRARDQGYLDALAARGIIPEQAIHSANTPDISGGYQGTLELLSRPTQFSAIFVESSELAAGCLKALREKRVKIPGDLSIISIDDNGTCQLLSPELAHVVYPVEAIARHAAMLALSLGDDDIEKPAPFLHQPKATGGVSIATIPDPRSAEN